MYAVLGGFPGADVVELYVATAARSSRTRDVNSSLCSRGPYARASAFAFAAGTADRLDAYRCVRPWPRKTSAGGSRRIEKQNGPGGAVRFECVGSGGRI
jgi:hypothetical protein